MAEGTKKEAVPKQDPAVVRTTQLAALAAIVDGEATAAEIDTIGTEVAQAFDVSAEDIKTLATKLVESHKSKNVAGRPITAARHGGRALKALSGRNKWRAIQIANKVIAQGGTDANESSFINELSRTT